MWNRGSISFNKTIAARKTDSSSSAFFLDIAQVIMVGKRPRTKPIRTQKNDASPLGQTRIRSPSLPKTRRSYSTPSGRAPLNPLLSRFQKQRGQREAAGDSAAWCRPSSTSHGYCKMSALGCVPYSPIFLPFLFFYSYHAWLSCY